MTDNFPTKPQQFIKDLNDFDSNEESLHMAVSTKNIDRLKDLRIKNLWLIGANDKELRRILQLVDLQYLNLYQVLAKDLTVLETQTSPNTIILNWNTKATELWDISKNKNLCTLEITDFSKINEINQLSSATQICNLVVGGGHNTPLKIKTLEPLSNLINLEYLGLTNIKVEDDTLKYLGVLKSLKLLEISNQFEAKEYAWLATRLTDTACKMFQAVNPCNIIGVDNQTVWDTMVTGRRKPFLLSTKDQERINKYVKEFERLKNELAD